MNDRRRLKVVLYDASGRGGICHYTFQLAQSLSQAGCDVSLICVEGYELANLPRQFKLVVLFKRSWIKALLVKVVPFVVSGHPIQTPARQPGRLAVSRTSLLGKLKALRLKSIFVRMVISLLWQNPDVIHIQWLADRHGELFFIKLLKRCGFKIVYTAHDLLPHDMDTASNREVFQKIYSMADTLIVHADSIRRQMHGQFDVDAKKLQVVPHGSNAIFFDCEQLSMEAARKEIGIPLDHRVILFFGLIKPYKGLEYLIEAFEEIKQRVGNVVLLIVGRIADDNDDAYQHYSQLLATLASDPRVKCITEYIPFGRVSQFFIAADIVALPHVKPSQSGVLLTALAAGKPVVVTDAGGLGELVKNGQNGFAIPPQDSVALAESVIEILNSPGLLQRMERNARLLSETTYAWSTIAAKTLEIYKTLHPNQHVCAAELANRAN